MSLPDVDPFFSPDDMQAANYVDDWYDDGYAPLPDDYNPADYNADAPAAAYDPFADPANQPKAKPAPIPARLTNGMNPPQREAVETIDGAVMVVAGPGSGKTRVLTHRIAALVETNSCRPWEILAVTFTNKAAAEMRERVEGLVGSAAGKMWISTFHSACVRILRANHEEANLPRTFSIIDSSDSQKLIKSVLSDLGMKSEKNDVKEAASIISKAKNAAMSSVALAASRDGWVTTAFDEYNKRLSAQGSVDFDDILLKTLALLNSSVDVKERYQRKFKYVLVDEYQDTNAVQYHITQILASGRGNLCVVGDLDQSVYSWRGATPEAMGGFPADYPDAKVIILEQNYRSTQAIVETYRAIIEPNPAIHRPNLFTENDRGEPVRMVVAPGDREESAYVVKDLLSKPVGESTAILMRTNSQTRIFEEALTNARVAYSVVGALKFYERAEVKDALSYVRFALNPLDAVSFARCVNTPKRGIGDATVGTIVLKAREESTSIVEAIENGITDGTLKNRSASSLQEFLSIYRHIEQEAQKGPKEALEAVAERGGLRAALKADKREGPDRVANLEELINGAAEFVNSESSTIPDSQLISDLSGVEQTMSFLENVSLVSSADSEESVNGRHAVLLTAHASKGKEFDHVWVVGVEHELFPHKMSIGDGEGIEEERRLLFVACSRPRLTLTLSRAKSRMMFGRVVANGPSEFLDDLPDSVEMINLRPQGYSGGGNYPRTMPKTNTSRAASSRTGGASYPAPSFSARPAKTAAPRGPRVSVEEASIGTVVEHVIFGQGVIENIEETRAVIRFSDSSRVLDLTLAPLTKIS